MKKIFITLLLALPAIGFAQDAKIEIIDTIQIGDFVCEYSSGDVLVYPGVESFVLIKSSNLTEVLFSIDTNNELYRFIVALTNERDNMIADKTDGSSYEKGCYIWSVSGKDFLVWENTGGRTVIYRKEVDKLITWLESL